MIFIDLCTHVNENEVFSCCIQLESMNKLKYWMRHTEANDSIVYNVVF